MTLHTSAALARKETRSKENSGMKFPPGLSAVLATERLDEREYPPPDFEREARWLSNIAATFSQKPCAMLNLLAEQASCLCEGGSGGISLIEESGEKSCFRWVAVAGTLHEYIGGSAARDVSPCAVTFAHGAPQLFIRPARYFPDLVPLNPAAVEVLVVPLWDEGIAFGTIWVVSHSQDQRLDREDVRIMERLGSFVSAALRLNRKAADADKSDRLARAAAARQKRTQAALDSAAERLRVSERRLSRVADSYSRELQAPLEAIRREAQSLAGDEPSSSGANVVRTAHLIEAHAIWLKRRIENRAQDGSIGYFNCEWVFDGAAARVCGCPPAADQIRRGSLPVIPGDEDKFAALFENLLNHALTGASKPISLEVNAEQHGGVWLFLCRRQGAAMAAASSLYLGQCQEFVASVGGKLWVENTDGTQTICFTVPA